MTDCLLDTNTLILTLRSDPEALDLMDKFQKEERSLYISVVTRTEILAGMHPHEEKRTMQLLSALTSLPIDEAIADHAGRLIYDYARQGVQLSFPDTLIAATALYNDLVLTTTNPDHFPIPDLHIYPFPTKK